MSKFDWLREWDAAFREEVTELATSSNVPPFKWIASGKRTKVNPRGEDRAFWNRNGPVWAKNWADFRAQQKDWEVWHTPDGEPGIELAMEFEAGGIAVKAVPDRIYSTPKGLLIVDEKSGSRKPDAGYQLDIYRLALDVLYGIPGEDIKGAYFLNRRSEFLPDYSPVKYNRERLEEMFGTAMAQIEAGHFLPNPGNQCARCSVRAYCEMTD